MMLTMERLPWSIPSVLTDGDISLFRAEDRVFEAMLDGWRAQMLARGLTTEWIKSSASIVTRFHAFTNDYPWKWQAHGPPIPGRTVQQREPDCQARQRH